MQAQINVDKYYEYYQNKYENTQNLEINKAESKDATKDNKMKSPALSGDEMVEATNSEPPKACKKCGGMKADSDNNWNKCICNDDDLFDENGFNQCSKCD